MTSLVPFFVLAYAISWTAFYLERAARAAGLPGIITFSLTEITKFGPTLAALAVLAITAGPAGVRNVLAGLWRWRAGGLWYLLVLAGPPVVMLVAIAIHVALGSHALERLDIGWPGTLGLLISLFAQRFFLGGGLGEEPGWRGFAFPRLQARYGGLTASLIIGVLWGFWHLPGNLASPSPVPTVVAQVLLTLALSVIFGWVYTRTRQNLLLVGLLHASINTSSAFFERVIPALDDEVGWIAVWLALALGIAAVVVVRRKRLLQQT
jgi:membrane protease YdiL (CAAX protease family)